MVFFNTQPWLVQWILGGGGRVGGVGDVAVEVDVFVYMLADTTQTTMSTPNMTINASKSNNKSSSHNTKNDDDNKLQH